MKGMQTENRPATAKERSLVEWLLRHGKPGAEQFLKQSESLVGRLQMLLRVSNGVCFAQEGEAVAQGAEHILADYLAMVNGQKDVGAISFKEKAVSVHWKFTRKLARTAHFFSTGTIRHFRMKSFPERQRKRDRIEG